MTIGVVLPWPLAGAEGSRFYGVWLSVPEYRWRVVMTADHLPRLYLHRCLICQLVFVERRKFVDRIERHPSRISPRAANSLFVALEGHFPVVQEPFMRLDSGTWRNSVSSAAFAWTIEGALPPLVVCGGLEPSNFPAPPAPKNAQKYNCP